ncbi:MAG: c-type cytochrome [Thiofilum sp.]|uniref:c-type cytochrome n=1 Tax=Thiofilum sp. TaxID=2212733 RepID=UPI0025F63411|nr:c-type cytochrome [Thiofilum sp.]MBK8452527.1 cytochrome c4 [Thiofilum sp.]
MKKALMIALATLTIGASAVAWSAGDAAAGKTKAAVCAACHAADGNSVNPEWPKLAGQHETYILKQLQNFKNKERENALMSPQAAVLSDQDMLDLAAYFSSQEAKPGVADMTKVELGEKIYRGGNIATGVAACAACHGPTGSGNPAAKFPSLQGQHATYTKLQLNMFRNSSRANDAGKMMRNIASKMSDAEIEAVAEYIAGLQK